MRIERLYDLVPNDDHDRISTEISAVLDRMIPSPPSDICRQALKDIRDLFSGRWPGYRACNTEYHDLSHTLDTTLAMVRLMHGATITGVSFTSKELLMGTLAALYHDTGYIQTSADTNGTGAKFTATHVRRSITFFSLVGLRYGLTVDDIADVGRMVMLTDLSVNPSSVDLGHASLQLLGRLTGAADLLSQMADRNYLEKLLFLYREFKEAGIGDYRHERHLLKETLGFYETVLERLGLLENRLDAFIRSHLAVSWGIDRNLYMESIENQRRYLKEILVAEAADHRERLKRGGIVSIIKEKYGDIY
ncbi:MAG: hypothetical protein ABIL58_21965 [Pseudomonadota bacterium]